MEPPPEPAPAPRRFTVADLLRLRRPTTGASSLHFPSAPTSQSPPRKKPKLAAATAGPIPTPASGTAPFAPISHPVLLSGTLSLPSDSAPDGCRSNCFSFSDPAPSASAYPSPAASVCCCLLDFDPDALGREICVLAWNYLPSVHLHGAAGVLEVVRWRLAEENPSPAPERGFLETVPLNCAAQDSNLPTHGCVFGFVRSVSVVFSIPQAKAEKRSASSVGFLAEILCCGCPRCGVSRPESAQGHKFEVVKFVYFVDAACTWRPLLVWFVGKLVYVSGLKKKLVSVAEKGSHTMLVSSTNTAMSWCPSFRGNLPLDASPEKCGGAYVGVITGIYFHGLVVELDDTAWLLVDDLLLLPPHSLRVGAVISIKNFRAMRLNFAWVRTVLLATCSRTCITVNSFSLVDSKSHIKPESKSLLRKFVDSLDMPARFWMLLLISCFKQKFTKLFSDKEIMGSQNKQGMVQAYATKTLPSKCQPQQNLIMKFCSHDCGSSRFGSKLEACKLVIPFSSFICKGESLWISSMLKFWNGPEEVGKSQGQNQFFCDGFSYPGITKRIISSEDLFFVLVGSIKTSPLSGRLQLVDSTGCIDVIIPDLPSNGCLYGVYEISNYKLALEGPMAYLDHCDVADPLSCKAIFQKLSYKKRVHQLNMYVIVCWRELNQIGPSLQIPVHINYRDKSFHLVKLSHIFPANNIQYQDMSGPILCAEALILPYNLQFIGQGECIEHAESFRMMQSHLLSNSEASMAKLWNIPCSLSFGSTNLCGTLVSSNSFGSDSTLLNDRIVCGREHTSRILLEFKEGSFVKYQLLRINGYYLLQCPNGNLTRTMEGCGCLEGGKISLDSHDKIWSIAITFDGNMSIKATIGDPSVRVASVKMDEPVSRNIIHDELKLVQSSNDFYFNSYFHLNFSCEAISTKMVEYNILCHVLNGLCASSSEVLSVSSCNDIMMPKEASVPANLKTEELVQGDLISVQGKVEHLHSLVCMGGRPKLGNEKYNLCIHVADNNHMVRLRGYLSKHSSTIGIGPGATVTFHRVFLTQHELLLTPVTYIEVTTISHHDLTEESVISPLKSNCLNDCSLSTVSLGLFFHRKHFREDRHMQFHCRVATVLKLVLDKSTNHGKIPNVKVRLAGFILADDGSSLCCCWADDARAELLLRLQEVADLDASVNLKLSKGANSTKLYHTVGDCLGKMLKRHTGVIVKNCGIPPDFSCRDLDASSVLHKVLSRFEDRLLKFIILNACWKGTLNVIASVINPDHLNGFNVELSDFPVRNMQMLWIKEVFAVDPLEEARRLYSILENS
ncbi:unnamed protein product [Urochloa humidicola]